MQNLAHAGGIDCCSELCDFQDDFVRLLRRELGKGLRIHYRSPVDQQGRCPKSIDQHFDERTVTTQNSAYQGYQQRH